MDSNSVLVGTSLMFGKSVLLLGDVGKAYNIAYDSLNFIGGYNNSINISASFMIHRERMYNTIMGPVNSPRIIMDKLDRVLKDNPNSILRINGVERLPPHWLMYTLQQWAEGRKVLLSGTDCGCLPIFDRFEIVRV